MITNNVLALDVGDKRIGVALSRKQTSFAVPLTTLANDNAIWEQISDLVKEHSIKQIVVGLPRSLNGEPTAQTKKCEAFAKKVEEKTGLTVIMQDEALTSVEAERLLRQSGKPFSKEDIDAQAASLILEDYMGAKAGK